MHLLLCSSGLGALPGWLSELRPAPTILFVDAAAKPLGSPGFPEICRAELRRAGSNLIDVDLLADSPAEIERHVGRADGVFVTGGYPIYLLEWSRRSGFLDVVGSAVRSGSLRFCGVSRLFQGQVANRAPVRRPKGLNLLDRLGQSVNRMTAQTGWRSWRCRWIGRRGIAWLSGTSPNPPMGHVRCVEDQVHHLRP